MFITAVQRTDLDWPEAVHEAFMQFETVHGGLDNLASATQLLDKERIKLERRRAKAQEASQAIHYGSHQLEVQQAQTQVETIDSTEPIASAAVVSGSIAAASSSAVVDAPVKVTAEHGRR
jgi:hypothetical protein